MHNLQTNERLANAYQLKLTPPLEKVKINASNTNYFVSLTTLNNIKTLIFDLKHMGHMGQNIGVILLSDILISVILHRVILNCHFARSLFA
jgi:hypothetical protein